MIEPSTNLSRPLLSDEELVKLFLESKDNRYFQKLYDRYSAKVYLKCFNITGDAARSEDLMHDIFYKIYSRLRSFNENAKFTTWLFSITHNQCMDAIRRRRRSIVTLLPDLSEFESKPDNPIQQQEDNPDIRSIRVALRSLKSEEKAMLYMKYIDNQSVRYIADHFKMKESAVKMRLKRIREKLRKKYYQQLYFN